MGGDFVSWVFHSPRRLVLVAAVVLLAALGLGGLLSRVSGATAGSGEVTLTASEPTATSTADPSVAPNVDPNAARTDPTGTDPAGTGLGAGGVQAPDAGPFVTAAVTFTRAWARLRPGDTPAQWHDRLDPLVTADLAAALRLTDPASLPGADPTGGAAVRYLAETSALVAVPLTDGSTVLITVVNQGSRWPVADVQPDVGDAGDVGGRARGAEATSAGAPSATGPSTGASTGATP